MPDAGRHLHYRLSAPIWGVVLAGAFIAGLAARSPSLASATARSHVVTVEGMRFNPQVLTVHQGDRIVWVNKDLFPHSATGTAKTFDSGSIPPSASWVYVARKPGDYAYACSFHPTMVGQFTVR